jgi:type VI secretion system secreted protein Hcp
MIATTALFLVVICSSAFAGYPFYITINGSIQRTFKGEITDKPSHPDQQYGLAFSYEVTSPTDRASGQASGKRQHGPVTITKEWGAASPQIFQAWVRNEVLSSVVLEFVRTDPNGTESVYQKITLTNARIVQIKSFKDLYRISDFSSDSRELESVSFSFEKILIENVPGKTSAQDDWRQK